MTNISLALSMLKPGQTLKIEPQGTSMCPLFLGGRDEIYVISPVFPLKRGEIALFLRSDGKYVIHRVYKVVKKDESFEYYMLGDNQTEIEGPIYPDQIHGIAESITRKGKHINCKSNLLYKTYSFLWLLFRPLRPLFQHILSLLRKLRHS